MEQNTLTVKTNNVPRDDMERNTNERHPMNRTEAMAYLLADGNLAVPCSRYGSDTEDCAPVAWRVAEIFANESGEPITIESLDHVMGLVVNDHDDIEYLIREYGSAGDASTDETPNERHDMTTTYTGHALEAYKLGVEAAEAAASWAADSNSDEDGIRRTLALLEAGDSLGYDRLPAMPNLSGEWADGPTPTSLYGDIVGYNATGGIDDPDGELTVELCEAWEQGVSDTFEQACEAELRRHLA